MPKNQKLGLLALAFVALGFGVWSYSHQPSTPWAGPVSPARSLTQAEQIQGYADLKHAPIPEGQKVVEKALKARWQHMPEEVMTAPSLDAEGEMVFFDKQVIPALRSDGSVIYAQGVHRSFVMHGPTIKRVERKPTSVTFVGQTPGEGFFMKALRDGQFKERLGSPPPVVLPTGAAE